MASSKTRDSGTLTPLGNPVTGMPLSRHPQATDSKACLFDCVESVKSGFDLRLIFLTEGPGTKMKNV